MGWIIGAGLVMVAAMGGLVYWNNAALESMADSIQ